MGFRVLGYSPSQNEHGALKGVPCRLLSCKKGTIGFHVSLDEGTRFRACCP